MIQEEQVNEIFDDNIRKVYKIYRHFFVFVSKKWVAV